jgi:hypothetical protein
MTTRRWAGLLGTTFLLLSMAAGAGEQDKRKESVTLNIERQPLGIALNTFAQQSGLQVVFFSEISGGILSPRLNGSYTPKDALEKMLANTQLSYEFINPRTVAIRAVKQENAPVTTGSLSSVKQDIMLAQVETRSRSTAANTEVAAGTAQASGEEDVQGVPEILVKGKKSLNTDIKRTEDAPQPYVVFEREEILRSQASNIEDFLRTRLPMNTSSASPGQTPGQAITRSVIDLRGLGENQTLILVDGRRMPGVTQGAGIPTQPDINGIPLAAIERIEVLPSTAGGIYGGSATGGVVNVILRRDFRGVEAAPRTRIPSTAIPATRAWMRQPVSVWRVGARR